MTLEEVLALVKKILEYKCLNKMQEMIFRQSWEGHSYLEIARNFDYAPGYVKVTGCQLWQALSEAIGEKVTKKNFRLVLTQRWHTLYQTEPVSDGTNVKKYQDWGDAVDASIFYGRAEELALLEQWIVKDHCRLVTLLGMGGMGKTTLSVKLAQQIKADFDYLIWRSLRNSPSIQDLLLELVQFLFQQQKTDFPTTVDGKILYIVEKLRSSRCLLILDNAETILSSGNRMSCYREGYEGYGQLMRCVAETTHQSCLLLTSREQPRGWAQKAGGTLPIRSLQLTGLPVAVGREVVRAQGKLQASDSEWKSLIEHYSGNPLVLKIVASAIRDLFDSNIAKFLQILNQGTLAFNDLHNLLDRQFNRLSDLEKEVIYWLAIERESVSFIELQLNFTYHISPSRLLESLMSLQIRSLLEVGPLGFTQQPAVMEYVTEKLIEQVTKELKIESIELFMSHALIKAQSKDYIRAIQVRMFLEPLLSQRKKASKNFNYLEFKLKQILLLLREKFSDSPSYGAGNLINLLHYCQIDLTGYDFSNLAIWQAYLINVNLNNVNLNNADLTRSVFTETFGSILSIVFSPNGQLVATGDTNGVIHLWRIIDGQQIWRGTGHTNWVRSVAFSPDGQTLVSGSADCKVNVWDINNGKCLKTFLEHNSRVWSVVFSPDGRTIASGSDDQTVKLWNVETGECLETLSGHTGRIRSVVFSPDGQSLVSGSDDQTVRLWQINTDQCFKILRGHTQGVRTVAFNPHGQIASSSGDASIKLWDATTHQCLKNLQGHTDEVCSIVFSPVNVSLPSGVGDILASSSKDQTIKLWDVRDGKCLKNLHGYTNGVRSVTCSPVSQTLAVSSADRAVRLWNMHDSKCWKTLRGHTGQVWSVAFSPNGQILASGSEDQTIKLWNVNDGQCLNTLQGHTDWVWSVSFSSVNVSLSSGVSQILASSSDDWTIKLWNVDDGQCLKTLQGYTNWVWSVTFSPDGQFWSMARRRDRG